MGGTGPERGSQPPTPWPGVQTPVRGCFCKDRPQPLPGGPPCPRKVRGRQHLPHHPYHARRWAALSTASSPHSAGPGLPSQPGAAPGSSEGPVSGVWATTPPLEPSTFGKTVITRLQNITFNFQFYDLIKHIFYLHLRNVFLNLIQFSAAHHLPVTPPGF